MQQLRYGILSTSSIAPRFISAVRISGAGEIVAVSSRTRQKAEEKAAQWDIPKAYGSHKELLEDENIDIVYISAVNAQHYPLAKLALQMGKHVVCEKPCTTTAVHTRELFALAKEKGLFLMEAEKMLFLPAILEVQKRIQNGELGKIHIAELSHSFPASYNTWLFDKSVGGGTLLSSGIYAVQLLIWLFGGIKEIQGVKSSLEGGAEWQYVLSGEMDCGMLFSIKNSTQANLDNTARLYGTKGHVEIPEYWKARKAVFHIKGQEPETVEFPCEYELMYEADHIYDCLREGRLTSPVVTEELSVAGIAALEKVEESWQM
ncbi:MAG: Gfo/Idh/MocA family oxidoreductase [Ruminococcaceae bacterium]|nr:Gfo/Idh/MocA family oxidoreductase [Oscillospiraceae bacterium]